MRVSCPKCNLVYDDAIYSTLCPHGQIMSAQNLAQKIQAIELMGKPLRFAHWPDNSEPLYIESIDFTGMVTIRGMQGQFASHLFVVMEPTEKTDMTLIISPDNSRIDILDRFQPFMRDPDVVNHLLQLAIMLKRKLDQAPNMISEQG